jgi:hypothetical protein
MRVRVVAAVATLVFVLASAPAQAQWFAGPFAGVSFGGTAFDDFDDGGSRFTIGGNFGWLGADSHVGFEVDFGYTPIDVEDEFFDFDARVTTFMVNGIFAGAGVLRPYVSGGVGIVKTSVTEIDDVFDNNDFGVNIGGGIMGDFSPSIGWRGDIRYFRGLVDDEEDLEFDVDFGDLDFWRAVFGVTFKFGG